MFPPKGACRSKSRRTARCASCRITGRNGPTSTPPFHGVLLDEEAKTNLMNTRHAGKVIDLELEPGKLTPCYVSIDKWTNTLEPMPVSLLEKRARIKEADLSEGKQMDFYGGGKVLLEGYTTRAGYKRDAYIQIDAAERNYSFTYDGLDRNRYAQENKEIYRQKAAEKKRTAGNGGLRTTAHAHDSPDNPQSLRAQRGL